MQNSLNSIQVASSFARAKNTYKQNAIIQEKMRFVLIEMLKKYGQKHFSEVFEFGVGNGEFSEILQANFSYKTYIANDINPPQCLPNPKKSTLFKQARNFTKLAKFDSVEIFDMNDLQKQKIFKKRFDLIASNACLQWLDTPQILTQLSQMLKPNALLCLGTFGKQNLRELAQLASISLEYLTLQDIEKNLRESLDILELKEDIETLDFGSSIGVFRHIKKSGANGLKSHQSKLNKKLLSEYQARFGGHISYHPIYILARKRA